MDADETPAPAEVAAFFTLHGTLYDWQWSAVAPYSKQFLGGWITTLWLSAAALALSLIFGSIAALASRSPVLPLRYTARLYVELVRGTPLLVQIMIFFYLVGTALGVENRYVVGVLVMAIFAGAYIAEIVRAGIESVAESQLESARAVGFTVAQTYRHVIAPQALRQVLPPLAGQFASLIKDSSLLSVISVAEFTFQARMINSATYTTLEAYLPLAIGYLILTLPVSLWTRSLERRAKFAS